MASAVSDWQIWHCYSSYVLEDLPNLAEVANRLVESGLAEVAILDGETYWARGLQGSLHGKLEIERSPVGPQGKLNLPRGPLNDFQIECIVQASWLDIQDRYLMGHPPKSNALRAFLPLCRLEFGSWSVEFYPQIKVYGDGVILLTFRILSGEPSYDWAEFVREQINLFLHEATAVWLPPRALRAYALARLPEDIRELSRIPGYLRGLDEWLQENSKTDDDRDFPTDLVQIVGNFDLAPVHGEPSGHFTLRVVASILEHAAHGAIRGKVSPAGVVRARRDCSNWGGSWAARPTVYLISFEGQTEMSKPSVQNVKSDLARLMLRSELPPDFNPDLALGDDLRLFSDYSLFVSREASLWVLGKKHAATSNRTQNWASVIYDKQVQTEFIDYRYAAHRQVEERSRNRALSLQEVLTEEERLDDIERQVESSRFGEINALIERADEVLKLVRVRERTKQNLARRAMLAKEEGESAAKRFEWLLTILVGLIGLPPFVDFVEPAVNNRLVTAGVTAGETKLILWVVCTVAFILVIAVLHRVTRPNQSRLPRGHAAYH